ncbi:MAG: hypothetical protein L0219_10575 [Phycisphaerales bacterium]|nr:hypothetical protein [Phycisphaerales bacterium]
MAGPAPDIASTGNTLKDAFGSLVRAIGKEPVRPVDLAAATGIGKDVSYRVIRATRAEDPLAVAHLMPGPAPLRRLIAGARKRGNVSNEIAQRALDAVRQYEHVIVMHAGDRTGLDGLISAWMPEVRSKLAITARQSVYRGYAQLYGVSCRTFVYGVIIVPNGDGKTLDGISVRMLHRIRRSRNDARVMISMHGITTPDNAVFGCNLRGDIAGNASELILKQFSSNLREDAELIRSSGQSFVLMDSTTLGLQGAADLTTVDRSCHCFTRKYVPDSGRHLSGPVCGVTVPARELVYDVLVHNDAFPNQTPAVFHFDTLRFGEMSINDPKRDAALMNDPVEIRTLGPGIEQLRLTNVRRYVTCLQYVFNEIRFRPNDFRVFRVHVEYPILGNQISVAFRKE